MQLLLLGTMARHHTTLDYRDHDTYFSSETSIINLAHLFVCLFAISHYPELYWLHFVFVIVVFGASECQVIAKLYNETVSLEREESEKKRNIVKNRYGIVLNRPFNSP